MILLIDNPSLDDLTLLLIEHTVRVLRERFDITIAYLVSEHLSPDALTIHPILVQRSKTTIKELSLDHDVIYLNGKMGLSSIPEITQSVCSIEKEIMIVFQNDNVLTPILTDLLTIDNIYHRSLIRESSFQPDLSSFDSTEYIFYPQADLDLEKRLISNNLAINTLGYAYDIDQTPYPHMFTRFTSPHQGLLLKQIDDPDMIPPILHLLSFDSEQIDDTLWKRALNNKWRIKTWNIDDVADLMIGSRWQNYYDSYEDSMIRNFVIYLAILESEGGVVIESNLLPQRLIPNTLLSSEIFAFFDRNYSINLSIFGAVPRMPDHRSYDIYTQLESLFARQTPVLEIISFIITYPKAKLYPHYWIEEDLRLSFLPKPFVRRRVVEKIEEVVLTPIVHQPIITAEGMRHQLTVNPRDRHIL